MNSTTIMLGLLFGSIGVAFFIYGKKQQRLVPFVAGVGLCVFPYVVHNPWIVLGVGLLLTASPWLFREL
jgi:hypothetical protein